jgi:hypothetical protein
LFENDLSKGVARLIPKLAVEIEFQFVAYLAGSHCENEVFVHSLFNLLNLGHALQRLLNFTGFWQLHPKHLEFLAVDI